MSNCRGHIRDRDVPEAVIREMESSDILRSWTGELRMGHYAYTRGTSRHRAYLIVRYAPLRKDAEGVLMVPPFIDFDMLLIALRLHRSEYVVIGTAAMAYAGAAGEKEHLVLPVEDRRVPHDEAAYPLGQRDVGPLEALIQQVRFGYENGLASSLRRFVESREKGKVDRFVDLIVALENLYGDDDNTSVAHKVAFRAAIVTGGNAGQRIRTYSLLKKAYGFRSAVVHGRPGKRRKQVDEMIREVEDVTRRSLRWFLSRGIEIGGMPSATDIDEMCYRSVPKQSLRRKYQ